VNRSAVRRIGHVLVRCGDHGPTLRGTSCRTALAEPVDGVRHSDHHAVVADLEVAGNPAGRSGAAR
jgi:hypothetical protein